LFSCWKQIYFDHVWKCSYSCFLKCFSCRNASKWFFFIFWKLFLRSAHQNDPKIQKKLIFNKKINFYETRFTSRSQTIPTRHLTWRIKTSNFFLKPSRWWPSGKSLEPRCLLPLWFQVRALWLLIWWSLEAYMVVNFRAREISWGARKLARTPMLN